MGYYTNYYLEIENLDDFEPEFEMHVAEKLVQITDEWNEADLEYAARCRSPLSALISDDSMKWYDHENDMRALSKEFPKCRFVLEGQGEEPEDLWRKYFYNGFMQYAPARIEYDKPVWDDLYNEDI